MGFPMNDQMSPAEVPYYINRLEDLVRGLMRLLYFEQHRYRAALRDLNKGVGFDAFDD